MNEQDKAVKNLINKVKDLCRDTSHSWQGFDDKALAIANSHLDDDLKKLFTDNSLWTEAFALVNPNGYQRRAEWMAERFLCIVMPSLIGVANEILKETEIDSVKSIMITKGFYTDISIIDDVAKNGSGDSQAVAAAFCSIKALRTLKGHKSSKIRKIYYSRLGPVECLDEMLDDKIADIRYEGIARAPFYYSKLSELVKEIARGPFSLLVEKIHSDYLPMLVANRNVKNSWISSKFERRISNGK